MAFTQKLMSAQISMGNGSFGASGGNSLTLGPGLRMSSTIQVQSAHQPTELEDLSIYGMTLAQMDQLSLVGNKWGNVSAGNKVTLQAGDESGMAIVFQGDIRYAYVDAGNMPEVCFRVNAVPGASAALKPTAPTTKKGPFDGVQLAKTIAGNMGFNLDTQVKGVVLRNPYLWGTGVSQIRQVAEAMKLNWCFDHFRPTIGMWDPAKGRSGGSGTTISPQTGLVGFPRFSQQLIVLTVEYSPQLFQNLCVGHMITVQSSLKSACGKWMVQTLTYELETFTPRGRWFVIITAAQTPASSGST